MPGELGARELLADNADAAVDTHREREEARDGDFHATISRDEIPWRAAGQAGGS